MDTRTKIASAEEAASAARRARAEGKRVRLVTGHFDPLVAAHAIRLRELADSSGWLAAAITEPERPLLTAQARAVLVAALADVDCVMIAGARTAGEVLRQIEPDEVYNEEADDERRTRELMLHVQGRHS